MNIQVLKNPRPATAQGDTKATSALPMAGTDTAGLAQPVEARFEAMAGALRHYVPLLAWVLSILALVFVAGKVISYGFLPADDALRHAAKAVSGKDWSQILLLRPGFELDIHAGWHAILGCVYRILQCNTETLVVLTVGGLMLLVNFSMLPRFRRPEAWLAALLACAIVVPAFTKRLFLGRPYLVTMTVFLTLLFSWSRLENKRPENKQLVLTILLIAAGAWIHSTWYLLIFPAIAMALAGRWRPAAWFGGCWAAGCALGACLTGHPIEFVMESYRLVTQVFGGFMAARQLAEELLPSDGDFGAILVVAVVLLWSARSADWSAKHLQNPIFIMVILGWLLGLKVNRFWWDWGVPSLLLWVALECQAQCEKYLAFDSVRRLVVTGALGMGVFFASTSDRDSRWTWNLRNEYLNYNDPETAGWWPEQDGIFYSADMRVFYETFFKNPTAPARYALGFEPGIMPPGDLAVVRTVQWNNGDLRAYIPWIEKLRPQDRLVIRGSWLTAPGAPAITSLEWRLFAGDLWIGRPKRSNSSS